MDRTWLIVDTADVKALVSGKERCIGSAERLHDRLRGTVPLPLTVTGGVLLFLLWEAAGDAPTVAMTALEAAAKAKTAFMVV